MLYKCGCDGMADMSVLETDPKGCRFKSCHPHHVGTSYTRSDFLLNKKLVTCFTVLSFLKFAKSHAVPVLLACKRAHDASPCYQLFASCKSSNPAADIPKKSFL